MARHDSHSSLEEPHRLPGKIPHSNSFEVNDDRQLLWLLWLKLLTILNHNTLSMPIVANMNLPIENVKTRSNIGKKPENHPKTESSKFIQKWGGKREGILSFIPRRLWHLTIASPAKDTPCNKRSDRQDPASWYQPSWADLCQTCRGVHSTWGDRPCPGGGSSEDTYSWSTKTYTNSRQT